MLCEKGALPITRWQILDWSKLKEFADDNFKFDENGRKVSKRVDNTVGKGEIAHYEQFLLFPQCFQKACFPGVSKGVIVWEWVNPLPNDKILAWSKFEAFADDKMKVAKSMILSVTGLKTWVTEIMLVTSIFSFSHSVFKSLFLRVVKRWDCVIKG